MARRKPRSVPLAADDGDRLARIAAAVGEEDGAWIRSLASASARRGERDCAIRRAASFLPAASVSGKAKSLAHELQHYCATGWTRERDRASPPPDASGLRRELFTVARLTNGGSLAWRRILQVLEA